MYSMLMVKSQNKNSLCRPGSSYCDQRYLQEISQQVWKIASRYLLKFKKLRWPWGKGFDCLDYWGICSYDWECWWVDGKLCWELQRWTWCCPASNSYQLHEVISSSSRRWNINSQGSLQVRHQIMLKSWFKRSWFHLLETSLYQSSPSKESCPFWETPPLWTILYPRDWVTGKIDRKHWLSFKCLW